MHELKQCFSTTTLPDNAKAMEELEGLVKQVAVEGHGTPGRYYPMKHAKARLDGSYTVMGGTLTSMPTLSGDAYTKTVKIKCPDAFTLQRIIVPDGRFKGFPALVMAPFTDFFRFLDLPPEIRQMMYDILLEEEDPISMTTYKPVYRPRRPCRDTFRSRRSPDHLPYRWNSAIGKWVDMPPSPARTLLLLNKQIYAEVVPTIYGSNTFAFDDLKDTRLFLETIGSNRKHLRRLSLDGTANSYTAKDAKPMFKLLKHAKGLRSITFYHNTLCRTGYNHATIEKLVEDAEVLLQSLYISQMKAHGSTNVLDLFKVTASADKCYECEKARGRACGRSGASKCGIDSCDEMPAHHAELCERIRKLIAQELGMDG